MTKLPTSSILYRASRKVKIVKPKKILNANSADGPTSLSVFVRQRQVLRVDVLIGVTP